MPSQVAIKVLRFDNDKREKLLRVNRLSMQIFLTGSLFHQRLRKEIEVWKRLDHKNIVPLLGTTSDFGSYSSTGMVSPWMDNGNLTTYLKTSLPLPERLRLVSPAHILP
jgi:serine/threonine protein kinase